ncbi:hypothetical protein DFH27DRAFT_656998 [Peziza echinospora]|nr:hypothetical protein DFH27DRAFT_656998 [Peziza echinospora]
MAPFPTVTRRIPTSHAAGSPPAATPEQASDNPRPRAFAVSTTRRVRKQRSRIEDNCTGAKVKFDNKSQQPHYLHSAVSLSAVVLRLEIDQPEHSVMHNKGAIAAKIKASANVRPPPSTPSIMHPESSITVDDWSTKATAKAKSRAFRQLLSNLSPITATQRLHHGTIPSSCYWQTNGDHGRGPHKTGIILALSQPSDVELKGTLSSRKAVFVRSVSARDAPKHPLTPSPFRGKHKLCTIFEQGEYQARTQVRVNNNTKTHRACFRSNHGSINDAEAARKATRSICTSISNLGALGGYICWADGVDFILGKTTMAENFGKSNRVLNVLPMEIVKVYKRPLLLLDT